MEIRCGPKKFGEIREGAILEVKCSSTFCGAGPGIVVLHRFDLHSGKMVETRRYRKPGKGGA